MISGDFNISNTQRVGTNKIKKHKIKDRRNMYILIIFSLTLSFILILVMNDLMLL